MILKVEVTRSHITEGVRRSCGMCPVALAIRALLPKNLHIVVIVGGGGVQLSRLRLGRSVYAALPTLVFLFICKFDRGEEVHPFEFNLDVPGLEAFLAAA